MVKRMQNVGGGSAKDEQGLSALGDGSRATSASSRVPPGAFVKRELPSFIRSKRVITDFFAASDFLAIVTAAVLAKWLYIGNYLASAQQVEVYAVVGLAGATIAIASFRNRGVYSFDRLRGFRGQIGRLLFGLAVSALILLSVGYVLKISANFSRGWMISWLSLCVLLLGSSHYIGSRILQRWASYGLFARNVAVYGSSDVAMRLIEHLSLGSAGLNILGVFDDLPRGVTPKVVVAGGLSDLIRAGQAERIDEVLIALPLSEDRRIAGLVDQLSVLPADIRLCPDLAAFQMRPMGIVNYDGVAVLELARRPLDDWAPVIKAVEDRLLAGLMLVVAAPAMLMIALAIKLDSKGPVFFRQRRHGFNHQVITVLKFRTMRVTEDGSIVKQAQRDDTRITAIGRFLRRTSLDELPQLVNVLKGEMSLVGPRPHALAHNEYYSALVERYASRHKMKPGITGWAQINGFRGETETPDKMRKRVEFDLYYIENWSLWFDLKIVLLTPFFGLVGRNAF